MAQLKIGETINLQSGGNLKVLQELGEGGQGYVYKVKHNSGEEYALKWYKSPVDWMYANIGDLIAKGAPSDDFIWPQMLTTKKDSNFGYVMELRPPEYKDIIKGRQVVDFNNFNNPVLTRISVAMKICDALKKLHAIGLCFHDINDGGFFINPANGKVLICDCDNVTPEGEHSPISGKMRYMAPEIVMGESLPSKRTDYFSLSIILFLLLYGNHPFEGAKALNYPCYTTAVEKEVYGKTAIFICDPKNDSNRPVKNIHTNVLNWWQFYPNTLNDAFVRAFGTVAITTPDKRMRETEWITVLSRTRDLLVRCSCGEETFARKEGCPFCNKSLGIPFGLKLGDKKIPVSPGKFLYANNTKIGGNVFEEVGQVVLNKKTGQVGIKNISNTEEWAIFNSDKIETVKNGGIVILTKGIQITFSSDIIATVI
jgi:serine/threonine protein kinase